MNTLYKDGYSFQRFILLGRNHNKFTVDGVYTSHDILEFFILFAKHIEEKEGYDFYFLTNLLKDYKDKCEKKC